MKLLRLSSLFVLFFPIQSIAQDVPTRSAEIRFAPFSLIDPGTSSIQAGVQLNFLKRLGASVDFGFPFNRELHPSNINWQYYKVRSELKYFFTAGHSPRKFLKANYLSIEGFFIPEKFRRENGTSLHNNGDYYTYDYNDVRITVLGACLKFGKEYISKGGFVFDFYGGLGFRNVNRRYNRHIETFLPNPFQNYSLNADLPAGNQPKPHVALGFKFGYLIWKGK